MYNDVRRTMRLGHAVSVKRRGRTTRYTDNQKREADLSGAQACLRSRNCLSPEVIGVALVGHCGCSNAHPRRLHAIQKRIAGHSIMCLTSLLRARDRVLMRRLPPQGSIRRERTRSLTHQWFAPLEICRPKPGSSITYPKEELSLSIAITNDYGCPVPSWTAIHIYSVPAAMKGRDVVVS